MESVAGSPWCAHPATTFVVIDEVPVAHWGIGGVPVEEYRRRQSAAKG